MDHIILSRGGCLRGEILNSIRKDNNIWKNLKWIVNCWLCGEKSSAETLNLWLCVSLNNNILSPTFLYLSLSQTKMVEDEQWRRISSCINHAVMFLSWLLTSFLITTIQFCFIPIENSSATIPVSAASSWGQELGFLEAQPLATVASPTIL